MQLLDAAVSHDHAISAAVAAGIFGGRGIGVGGSVLQELKEQFTIRACGDEYGLNENCWARIAQQVDLDRFAKELRCKFDPLGIIERVW